MKHYAVTVMRGHQGRHFNVPITFYFKAQNMIEAMSHARRMPGVKHTNTRAIMGCREITEKEYIDGRKVSAYTRANGY